MLEKRANPVRTSAAEAVVDTARLAGRLPLGHCHAQERNG